MKSSPIATGGEPQETTIVAHFGGPTRNPGKAEESKTIPKPGNLAGVTQGHNNLPRGRAARTQ